MFRNSQKIYHFVSLRDRRLHLPKLRVQISRQMTDFPLPSNLPVPVDDGGARHLVGRRLPTVALGSTGAPMDLTSSRVVIYCYPMTGRPDEPLPDGWNDIPGARGCTPQSTAFRDHYQQFKDLGVEVVGISTQTTAYQTEMVQRLDLPFNILSDVDRAFASALDLPTFQVNGMILLKRLTMIVNNGIIEAVHYPVFPSDSDPPWVLAYLNDHP